MAGAKGVVDVNIGKRAQVAGERANFRIVGGLLDERLDLGVVVERGALLFGELARLLFAGVEAEVFKKQDIARFECGGLGLGVRAGDVAGD